MTALIIVVALVVFFYLFNKKDKSAAAAPPQAARRKGKQATVNPTASPEALYHRAKLIAQTFCQFPSYIDPALKQDIELMVLIDKADQPEILSDDRRRYQGDLKKIIFDLLDRCLAADPEHAPALLLYPRVADWNTRATDRPSLIGLYERLLPSVEKVVTGTRGYDLIKKDIKGMFGNYFDKVERHLADFHNSLATLYMKAHLFQNAITQYEKAEALMPPVYAGAVGNAYAENRMFGKALQHLGQALIVRMEKSDKDRLKQYYGNIETMMECQKELFKIVEEALAIIDKKPDSIQKELYSRFPAEHKSGLSGVFRNLEDEGFLTRTKKGSTYQLTLQKSATDALSRAKELLLS